MYSHRSEHSHSRQYNGRSARQWDGYDDRREEWRETHRDVQRESYHKYGGDGHSSTQKTSRSREYSDSPKRPYSRDSLNRDRSRKSPVRRRMSSPDWGAFEKKRQRFTEGDEDDYRYRRVPEDKSSRQSPDSFSRTDVTKDLKHTVPQDEDFRYRKTTQDSRHRHRHEEFTYKQQRDDLTSRRLSGYYKDRDGHERSWDRSQERTRSQDHSTKSYAKPRERHDSPPIDHEDRCLKRTRIPLNASGGQSFESDVTHQSPEQKKSTQGFQRFLDVLNKGVNVATLTQIVTQPSTDVDVQPQSTSSFMNTGDYQWSPRCERQHESHKNTSHWKESEGSQRPDSPQPRRRSFSPRGRSLSDETSLQRADGERGYFRSNRRSGSPSVVEKTTLTPDEEHKHRYMQGVLEAIGMNLGFEELGQMSHRIQERLYGKKDSDVAHNRRGSRERDTRRPFSPRLQSRSSSSRSSRSPSTQEYYTKKESYSAQEDVRGAHQAVEYGQNSSNRFLQESEKSETNSQESTAAFPHNPPYILSEPSLPPVMPMYSPVNSSALSYPALPPNLPHIGPGLFLPRRPPLLPFPRVPPLNIFPAVLAQTRHLLPQRMSHPPPFFNLPIQPLNTTQKSKTLSRPRCLQVIETKQPG
ncbi:cyclin-dependent kinase 12-like [Chaetodon trifascialis]|uniref:cyclin-dependent kinase 12-like n=1 Tax=Chaetodon trifascialis TaxID=109706 RepID=UPI003993CC61